MSNFASMKLRSHTFILLLLLTLSVSAQKHKQTSRQKEQVSAEELAHQDRLHRMTMATQRIMVIDSVVLDKKDFLLQYHLNPEEGSIDTYGHFFHTQQQPNGYVYLNAIGSLCIMSQEDGAGNLNLYASDKEGNGWTQPRRLQGINDTLQFQRVNYPFMMPDGFTLYFSAEGGDGLGGYDIYVTTYDAEEDRFLAPENIGMPFNSEANDYMLVINEYDRIGWFATDRRQEEGKVCIYTFVPADVRESYDPEEYSEEQIARFAQIADITGTWKKPDIDEALERLKKVKERREGTNKSTDFTFVINDDVDYHQLTDFKAAGNAQRYQQLVTLYAQQATLGQTLNQTRERYNNATADEKCGMATDIVSAEQQQQQLRADIRKLEKQIRNEEIKFLKEKNGL